jgi:hypothetical protein
VSLVFAGIRVKHNHTMVAVPVGDVDFICFFIDENLRGQPKVLDIVTSFACAGLPDLHQEFSVLGKFHDHAVMEISLNARHGRLVGSRALGRLPTRCGCCSSSRASCAGRRSTRRRPPAVATNPDVTFVVDGDAVIGIRPLITFTTAAPMMKEISGLIEFENGRRRNTAFCSGRICRRIHFLFFERSATMNDPHMILRVNGYTYRVTQEPVVRQRLGP